MTLTDIISKIILYAKRAIVNDNSSSAALSVNQTGSGDTAIFKNGSSLKGTLKIFSGTGSDFDYDGGSDGVFIFSNTSSASTKATVLSGANVGIGTSNPTATLDVNGSIKGHFAEFNNPTGDTKVEIGGSGAVYLDLKKPNTDDYDFRIGVDSGIASIQTPIGQSLEINAIGGNVGIGASVPARKLHVNGLVRLQGLPTYASNAAAIAGGLAVGDIYIDVVSGQGELRIVV